MFDICDVYVCIIYVMCMYRIYATCAYIMHHIMRYIYDVLRRDEHICMVITKCMYV